MTGWLAEGRRCGLETTGGLGLRELRLETLEMLRPRFLRLARGEVGDGERRRYGLDVVSSCLGLFCGGGDAGERLRPLE